MHKKNLALFAIILCCSIILSFTSYVMGMERKLIFNESNIEYVNDQINAVHLNIFKIELCILNTSANCSSKVALHYVEADYTPINGCNSYYFPPTSATKIISVICDDATSEISVVVTYNTTSAVVVLLVIIFGIGVGIVLIVIAEKQYRCFGKTADKIKTDIKHLIKSRTPNKPDIEAVQSNKLHKVLHITDSGEN